MQDQANRNKIATRKIGRRKFLAKAGPGLGVAGAATLGFPAIVSGAKGPAAENVTKLDS